MTWWRDRPNLLVPLLVFVLARGIVLFGLDQYTTDVPLYRDTAVHAWQHGERAYAEFWFPYPPLSLPFVYLPLVFGSELEAYRPAFQAEMALVDLLCLALLVRLMRRLGGGERGVRLAVVVYALGGLAVGHLLYDRLDLLIAACFLGFVLALVGRHGTLEMGIPVWAGALVKLVPLLWLPLDWAVSDSQAPPGRARWLALGKRIALGVLPVIAVLVAWNGYSGGALFHYLGQHGERGIELESLWATPVLLARLAAGAGPPTVDNRFGGQHLGAGVAPEWWVGLSKVTGLALLAAFYLLVWKLLRRQRAGSESFPGPQSLFLAALAALLVLVVGQRVLSPQYFIWLLPGLAAWVGLGRAAAAVPLVGAVYYLTWDGFSRGYWRFVNGDGHYILIYAARNALLLALVALVVWRAVGGLRPPAEALQPPSSGSASGNS